MKPSIEESETKSRKLINNIIIVVAVALLGVLLQVDLDNLYENIRDLIK